MAKCLIHNLSPSYCYKRFKCRCASCLDWKRDAARRTNNKERARERSRIWRLDNVERSRGNAKSYQARYPEMLLKWKLRKYGLTVEDYKQMLLKQNNKCAICGGSASGMQRNKTRLCVDHDAKTGKIRGLLCGACNVGIGHFGHSSNLLGYAIKYLEENGDVD